MSGKWPPVFNPEKLLSPPQKARLQGKIDYLEAAARGESDCEPTPMKHYYQPGSADEHHYMNGWYREFHDCVEAVMGRKVV